MLESAEIEREVHRALGRDPRVGLYRELIAIEYQPDGGLVLEGETESLAAKKIALELAGSIRGLTGIVDRLRVAPARPMGDGTIHDQLRTAISEEEAFAQYAIQTSEEHRATAPAGRGNFPEIAVSDEVVTLDGPVESISHKRLAGVLAWWVPGTRG